MSRFFDIEKTKLKDFELSAKDILEKYYLSPYPKNHTKEYQRPPVKLNIRDKSIEREIHGTMHASRVAAYVDHFHALHKKYDRTINKKMSALAESLNTTPQTLLTLTKYAALFHDSARQNEGIDYWDSQSAENGRRYLMKNGVPARLAKLIAIAAANKGNSYEDEIQFQKEIKSYNRKHFLNINIDHVHYLRKLIGDSDCLDIIRCVSVYDVSHLNFYHKYKHNKKAMASLINTCQMASYMIFSQCDAMYRCVLETNNDLILELFPDRTLIPFGSYSNDDKVQYEHAKNPYLAIAQDLDEHDFFVKLKLTTDNKYLKDVPITQRLDLDYKWIKIAALMLMVVSLGAVLGLTTLLSATASIYTFCASAAIFSFSHMVKKNQKNFLNNTTLNLQSPTQHHKESNEILTRTKSLTFSKVLDTSATHLKELDNSRLENPRKKSFAISA